MTRPPTYQSFCYCKFRHEIHLKRINDVLLQGGGRSLMVCVTSMLNSDSLIEITVWDYILGKLPQRLFAKLAAGPCGRPAKACLQPSLLEDPLAGQPNTNQTRINNCPKPALKGIGELVPCCGKCVQTPIPTPTCQRQDWEKNPHALDWGNVGYMTLPRNNLPKHLIKGCATKQRRDPHQRTQELWRLPPLMHTGAMDWQDNAGSMMVTTSCDSVLTVC